MLCSNYTIVFFLVQIYDIFLSKAVIKQYTQSLEKFRKKINLLFRKIHPKSGSKDDFKPHRKGITI